MLQIRTSYMEIQTANRAETTNDRLYDVEEVCERLGGIGRTTFFKLLSTGALGSVKIGRRRLVPGSQIDAFIAVRLQGRPEGSR